MNHKMDIILNDIFDMEQPESEEVVEDIQVIESNPENREIDIEEDYVQSRGN